MNRDEVLKLPTDGPPVLCADGLLGQLLIFPGDDGLCGIQVPGETEHRWVSCDALTASAGGAIRQDGAPKIVHASCGMVQKMLVLDWISRGGTAI